MTFKKYLARKTYRWRKNLFSKRTSNPKPLGETVREKGILRCRKHLNPVRDNSRNIKPGDKLLLTMGKNENKRIPHFIDYYTQLGIDHFIFIDNDSDIAMADVIPDQSNISLWHTKDNYPGSNFGVDWMNYFNRKYGIGHWVLTVDLDEFFVFPDMERRTFGELTTFLDTLEQKSFFAPLIDMYPKGSISSASVPSGESPLPYANFFDSQGYFASHSNNGNIWLRGGPRCRIFNQGDVQNSPTLNKTPLIKWSPDTLYLSSTHTASPAYLNPPHPQGINSPTGALLHFKFISEAKEKALYAVKNKNHYDGSREYKQYLQKLEEEESLSLYAPCSREYLSTSSLVEANLMSKGLWSL